MSEAGPRVNGPASPTGKYIDGIDPDDPQYIKNLQRPAEVKEDLQQMENRSRVSVILNSQAFKDELEQVVEEQLRNGPYPASLIALQQITDLLLPQSTGSLGSLARASSVIPINDLRGVESSSFVKGEKLLRCKVASLYRLVDLCGWSHGIHNHISARVSPESENFLLNPFGLTYSEITASSLVKVDVNGDIVEPGSTHLGVYRAGFSVHSAIHQARPDIKCIVHLHTPSAVAVSALKCGLLAMSQEALICGNVSYHDFHGVAVDADERERLARNLGVHNKILILRNRGVLACGESVEEAFHFTFNVMAACEAQVKAMPVGLDNIVIPSVAAREQTHRVANQGGGGVDSTGRKWKIGELEFEALMRTLDNSGFRTGHVYKMPIVKQEKKERSNSEVEIPPASSSFTYIFDGDYEHSKYVSPVKAAMERQKKAYKAGWLTTPNTYKKKEVDEIGTTTPKKITKWVPETDSPNRPGGGIVKIEHPNQFAPQGENPKEFKEKQKSIKKDYYEERITAGPQSRILEGITWDEAQRAKDGQLGAAGDQFIVVGAASKGIIQRDHQHNAVVYRQYYAANPFENMSEAEIDAYQAEVQRRERGELETSVEEEVQPPVVEVPAEVPVVQYPPEPEIQEPEVRYTRAYEASIDTPVTSRPRPSQGYTAHKDVMLAQLAEKVVQTVIHDALSVAHQGKGQQTLIGADPVRKHHFLDHLSVGGKITSEHRNMTSHCKPIQCVDSCQGHSKDKCSDCQTVRTCANNVNRINHTYSGGHTECTGAEVMCLEAGACCLHPHHENLLELNTDHVQWGSSCSYTRPITRGRGEMAVGICRGGPHEEFSAAVVWGSCCDYSQTGSCISEQQGAAGRGSECSEKPFLRPPDTIRQQPNAQQPPSDVSSSRTDAAINQRSVHSSPNSRSILLQSKPLHDALKCLPAQACDASVGLKNLQRGDNMAALTHGGQVAFSFHEKDLPDTVLTTKAGAAMYKNLLVIDEGPYLEYLPHLHVPSEENLVRSPAQGQGTCQAALLNTWPFDDHKLQLKSIDSFMDNTESVTLLAEFAHSADECKKNPIDDVFLLDNMKSSLGGLSKNAFDSCNIIQHVDFMTMSRDNSFRPPEITVYPVSRVGMPPGPGSSNVQRATEAEGRPRYEAFHRSPDTVSRSPGRGGAREDTASKQRWTPKQKSQGRQLDQSLDENVSFISEATRREEKRVLERSFGRQGQLDMDPEQIKFDSLRREDALRKYREEKRARRNEEARVIYEMRRGDPNFSSSNITDGLKKDMGNNRAYGYNKNDRDNEMSRTESTYRTCEDAVRNEANIRKSAYYMGNDRARRNDGVSDEKENPRNQDNKLHEAERRTGLGGESRKYDLFHEAERRTGLGGESHKYDLSDDNSETFNVDSLDAKISDTNDSDTDHFSVVSKKTESSKKLIKELKDKIEDRKSRMLEKTWDVGGDKSAVVEKLADIMDERQPVPANISVSQVGSVAAPTHLQQPVGGSKDKSDIKGDDHVSVVSDDTVLEKTDDDKHGSHRQDERDRRSGGRYREKSGERDRRRGRQGEEESRDRERRGGKREEEGDREKSEEKERKEQRDEEGVDKDRYRGRSGERERRRGRRDEEEEIDRDRYRGRSGERERRRGRRDEEEEIDRDRYRGRSGERERRRGRRDDEEDMDRNRYRGRSGERERRRGRRDEEEEEMDRERYRGRSGERERRRGRRDEEDEEMDRDHYRGRSGERERRRGRREDEEEEMDRDRYRGRSGERERRRGRRDEEEEEINRDRYRGRSGERERRRGRRDEEGEEIDRDRYRGRSGERRRGARDNEGDASNRQRGKSAERERRRGRRDYEEDEVAGEETDRRKRRQGYDEEEEVSDQYTGKNEDKYRQRGRRDENRLISDDERRRRKRDEPLDTSTDDKSVDISIDSKEILKLDDSLKGKVARQTEATEDTKAAKERQSEHDKSQRRQERTNQQKSEDKSRSSRKPASRDDLSAGLALTSQARSGSRQETNGIEPAPSDHTPAHQTGMDNVLDGLSKSSQKHGVVSPPLKETMDRSIRAETDSKFHDSAHRKNEEQTKSDRKATQERDQLKPKEQKLDDSADSVKGLVPSSKISADASQAGSQHSRKSAGSSSHVGGHRPSQTGPISAQTVVNIKPLVKEPVEHFQSKDHKSDDLQQVSQKASAMITDLDEGFDSVHHLPVKKDMKTDISLQGADHNRTHEVEKIQKPVSDYETTFITPETVKTDLGVLKTSADKISAGYNKYTKDIGRDRQERKPGSTGGRHGYKDLEIPEISLTKDNIVDKQRFPEKEIPEMLPLKDKNENRHRDKEIPEISLTKGNIHAQQMFTEKEIPEMLPLKDKNENRQRYRDTEIPEISLTKGNIHAKQKFTEKEIPEMLPLKDKNRQRYIDREIPEMSLTEGKDDIYGNVEIPEISLTKGKTERGRGYSGRGYKKAEIPETMPIVDKAKDRQKHTKKEISEIRRAKQAMKEPAERFLSMDKKIDIPQGASQKGSAVIVTDLDGDFDSVHHFPDKDNEAVINFHGLDKKRTHEDKKIQKPVGDYEAIFITPETVKTDLGVLKTSADKISAEYNKYTKDIGRDKQERKPGSTGGRHGYKDLEIPEISLTKDNIVDKQRFPEKEIPEMLPLKDKNENRHRDKEIPEISLTKGNIHAKQKFTEKDIPEMLPFKDKDRQRYIDREVPEMSLTKGKTERGHGYRKVEIPETMPIVDTAKGRQKHTKKEISEIQGAKQAMKEPAERFLSMDKKIDIPQGASQKGSAVIVTDLDGDFDSVHHFPDKDDEAVINFHGLDKKRTHEDKKIQKPVGDYETTFITPETVKTDLGVLKASTDKISAGYNKYTKDIGRDRQERKPRSTGGRHGYKDLGIPEISLTKDNIVDKQRFPETEIPEMLPLKDKNRQRYIDENIPEMSFTKDKTEHGHGYGNFEIPETMSVVDKTTDRQRYTNKEIPEIQVATPPVKDPVERFQSKVIKGGDLQQAYQKVSAAIVTDLDEGFGSVPHLPFKKDMKTDISLQGTDRNRTHEVEKIQKPVGDYETAFITPEIVKTDLGVLKTSADKISAGYNKYTKDIGRDRHERKPGSTGGRHGYKDLGIPEISLTKDNIVDKQRFPEKEIPEMLPLKDKNESMQKHRDKETPEISVKQATAVKGQRLQFPESPSAKVKGLAVEVLKSPVIAHISGRAPRAVPEDDDDEKVGTAKIQETDIDQEVEAEQRKKTALVGMKKTSDLEDTTATSGVDHEAAVTADSHKPAFDPEVYKEIKARSLAYKENPTKSHASKAKVSPDTSTVETKSHVDKDDRGRPSIYKENTLDSDRNMESKTSDIYKEGYKDYRTRSDNSKDRAKSAGTTEGRGQYDTYTEKYPLPVQDIAKPDARSDGRYKSDAYKDSRGRSDALKVGRDSGIVHKDDDNQLDAYKDSRTLYDKAREDIGKHVIDTEDEVKSDTTKLEVKSGTTKQEVKSGTTKQEVKSGTTKQDVKSGTTKQDVKSGTKSRLGEDKGGSNQSKEGGHRLDINSGDLIRATKNAVEMSDLKATVPTVHRTDANRLLDEKVIKDADNKIQKRIKSEVNELRNKLPQENNYRLVSETSQPTDKTAPTSQHIKSPEMKVSKAVDVSTAPATVDLTRPATIVLTKPATVGLTKPATVGLTKPATVGITKPATVGITKPSTVGITKPSTVGITKPASVEITKPATVEITKPAIVEITKPSTGQFTRPVEDVTVNLAAGRIPDSYFGDDKPKGGLQVDKTASSKKILANVLNKIPESPQQKNRKDDRTKFVKRTGPDDSGDSEDESNEKRKDHTKKGNSGPLSKVANETTSRLGRESGTMYPASRDEGKLSDMSNLRGATVGERKAVGKRNNRGDRSTDVALDSALSPREVDKQYPARGDGQVSDVNVQDMPVQGDNRFFKRELSLELAAEAAAKAGNRTSKPVLPDDEPRVSSPEIASVRKDAQDVGKPPSNVRAKSAQRVPGASVRSGREAERSHPDRRNVRSLSPKDVFDDNERQQRTESRTRPPALVPRANQARVEAGTAYPDRRNVRSLSPKDVFVDDKKQQHTESRTRPPALVPRANQARVEAAYPDRRNVRSLSPKDVFVDDKRQQHTESRTRPPRANQARVEAGTAYPGRRNERAVSAADISNIDARRSYPDSRGRSSQLSSQPPSNRPWRSASETDVPREDKHFIDDRAKASFPEADDPYSREDQTFDDHELSEAVTRPQEKQKYAGFVKRTGRGSRKSLPLRGVSLEGEDKDIEKTADDRLDEMKAEHTKDDTTKLASQKDEPSEVIIRDHFSTVVHENPIEVTVDNDDTPPQPSPKKGIMGFFGKVKGKSADFVRMLDRSKKKGSTAYYEEGEKRKIKKLSKEKEKEETKVLYFEKSEEASDSFDSFDDTFDTIRTSDEEFPEAAHESPPPTPVVEEKPLQGHGSVRYQNRPPPFKPPKPLSTFIDPSEALDAIGGSASDEDEGSPTGRRKGLSDDDSPRGGQFQTFMSFGKSNIGPSLPRPSASRFGFSRSPDAGSRRNVLDAEVAGDRMQQTTETDQTSMTPVSQPVQGDGAEKDGQSGDTFDVQLRSKTDQDPVTRRSNTSSKGSVRRSGASQRVSAEARLSDFISNLPPPSFEPDAAAVYDASFPPPPDTSTSSML